MITNSLRWLSTALTLVALVATLLPLWRYDAWWIRACEFPRVQIIGLTLVAILGLLLPKPRLPIDWVWAAALAICLAFQLYRVFPYTPLAPRQVLDATPKQGATHVSILVANVLQHNRQAAPLLAHIDRWQPDLVLAVEVDSWWLEQLAPVRTTYPYTVERPLDNTYGMALFSQKPLVDPRVEELIETGVPSIHTGVRLESGRTIRLYGLHPRPPYPAESSDTTERDGELLLVGREIDRHRQPTLVAGDLNDVAWSYTTRLMQRVSGLLDPRQGRGLYSTFHAGLPLVRWPLDHVFHSEHFKLVRLERLGKIGSDHFPIFVELSLDPLASIQQEAPQTKPGDTARAVEKIEAAEQEGDANPTTGDG